MLLENGADVNARDGFFYTPLHLACVNGATACVEALLEAGADPTLKAQGGVTPLLAARKEGVRELIEAALQTFHSMDICISSEDSDTDVNSDEGSLRGSRILKRKSKSTQRRRSAGDVSGRGSGRAPMDEGVDGEEGAVVATAAVATTPGGTASCTSAAEEQQREETMALKGSVDVRTLPMTESKVTTVVTGEGEGGWAVDAAVLTEQNAQSDKGNDNDMDVDDGDDNEDVGEMVSRCREAVVSSSPVANTRGRRLIATGRPVSRLPKEDGNEQGQERGRERGRGRTRGYENPLFRRSSNGNILEKIFNGSLRRGDDSGSSSGGGGRSDADSGAATKSTASSSPAKIVIPVPPERLLHTAPKIVPPPLPPQQVDAVETETESESEHLPPLPQKARAFSYPLPPHKEDETTSVASGESGDGGKSQILWTASDPREGSITAALIAARKSINFPLSTSSSGSSNSQRRRLSAYASESVTEAAATATATLNGTAPSAAALEGGEQHPRKRAYRKRRAKSLPPSWDNGNSSGSGSGSGHRRKGKHPRRARLESRPCMKGPTAVIETLALDEDADNDDAALGCWLRGALAGTSAGTEEGAGAMTAAAAAAVAAGAVAAAAVATKDGEEFEGSESSWFRFDDRRSFS